MATCQTGKHTGCNGSSSRSFSFQILESMAGKETSSPEIDLPRRQAPSSRPQASSCFSLADSLLEVSSGFLCFSLSQTLSPFLSFLIFFSMVSDVAARSECALLDLVVRWMDQQLITSPVESWTMSSKSAVKKQRPEKPRVSLWISSRRRSMMSKAWRVGCCFCYLDDDHRWARSWKVMFLEILDFLEFCFLVFLIFLFIHMMMVGRVLTLL